MPKQTYTKQFFSEPSDLSPGVHPAFLMAIIEDATPPDWDMFKSSPRMYRWHFATAHSVDSVTTLVPELVTAITSKIFSGGKQPSKNYTWHCTLVGHEIQLDEEVDLDPVMPVPCQLAISRTKQGKSVEWAIVDTLYPWPDGQALLTDALRKKLALWWKMKQAGEPEGDRAPAPTPAPTLPPAHAAPPAAPASTFYPSHAPAAGAPQTATATRQAW